jgi:hypothetical protein
VLTNSARQLWRALNSLARGSTAVSSEQLTAAAQTQI